MKYTFTDQELKNLEDIERNLILTLFNTTEKRYAIHKALKDAYFIGKGNNEPK